MATKRMKSFYLWVLVLGTVTAGGLARADGLVRVQQGIFGMDCAPCAYGLERGLKKLTGVQTVQVSLNQGMAVVQLVPDSTVGFNRIRDVVRRNGFTPKEASGELVGTLAVDGDVVQLQVVPDRSFRLNPAANAPQAWEAVRAMASGVRVAAQVRLASDVDETKGLELTSIRRADLNGQTHWQDLRGYARIAP